jgi:hypothetical protein
MVASVRVRVFVNVDLNNEDVRFLPAKEATAIVDTASPKARG